MYSLEQVIYFLEQRQQTEDWNIRDAAIAYLKAYREDKDDLTALRAFWKEQHDNHPLDWDDLRKMEGMPVWWAHGEVGEWLTIYCVPSLGNGNDNVIYATTCSGVECWIWRKDLDKFQYYRKERK